MKKFFGEFKKFILRGNVLDMAVGVIVGGAFTAIVTALTNNILRPIINWIIAAIFGDDSGLAVYTFLRGDINDLEKAIYIDWGAFISAIINFILIAFVLFLIIRTINRVSETGKKAKEKLAKQKEAVKKYEKEGLSKKEALARFEEDEKAAEEAAKKEEEEKAAAAAKEAEEKATANTRLLEEIRDLLKKN